MKKTRILGTALSVSIIMSTFAVFLPGVQAANSKLRDLQVANMLPAQADQLKAEWFFDGADKTEPAAFTDTIGQYSMSPVGKTDQVQVNDSAVMGSTVKTWSGGGLKYAAADDKLDMTGSSATYESWMNISGAYGYQGYGDVLRRGAGGGKNWGLLAKDNKSGKGVMVYTRGGKTLQFSFENTNTSNSVNANNDWQHVVIVKEVISSSPYKEKNTVYLNGENMGSVDLSAAEAIADAGDLYVSYTDDTWHQENRWFANFRVFGSALTAADVQMLYKRQAIYVNYIQGEASLTALSVNGKPVAVESGTKAYQTTVKASETTAYIEAAANGSGAAIEYMMNGEPISNYDIPLVPGDNLVTITISAPGEDDQVYTVNIIRLPQGQSPVRNANLSVLGGKTMAADWYFDVCLEGSTSFIDEVNGIKMNTYNVDRKAKVPNLYPDSTFGYYIGADRNTDAFWTSNQVPELDNARTWSGWVNSFYGAKSDVRDVVIWGKDRGEKDYQNWGFNSGHKGWQLRMMQGAVVDNKVQDYYYEIRRGEWNGGNAEIWQSKKFENKKGEWKYLTVSLGSNFGEVALYVNGEKQELTDASAVKIGTTVKAVQSDAGTGVSIGRSNHSSQGYVRSANLRVLKEQISGEEAAGLYQAEALAVGLIQVPVEITFSEFFGDVTASADLSAGNHGAGTALIIVRYDAAGKMEACSIVEKGTNTMCEATIPAGDADDVI